MALVRDRGGDVGCLAGQRRKSRIGRAPLRTENRSDPLWEVLKSRRRTEEAVQEALPHFDCAGDGLSGAGSI